MSATEHSETERIGVLRHPAFATITACLAVIVGLILVVRPTDSVSPLARLIGAGLVLLGATFLVRFTWSARPRLDQVDGVVWIAVGTGAVVWTQPTVRGVAIVVGVALLVTGVLEMAATFRGANGQRLAIGLGGAISVALGVATLAWPTVTTLVLSLVVGVRLIVAGGVLLAARFGHGRGAPGEQTSRWRLAFSMGALAMAFVAAFVSVAVQRAQPNAPGAFYDTPDGALGASGTLIRHEPIDPFIDGASAERVLYVTADADGTPTTATGIMIVPDGPAPAAGRPVLAFTHGTIGIARRCAPSLLPGDVYAPAIPGLADFLEAGFVVVATDYAGLGSDATTGYLVGTSEAHSTLDAVRAAQHLPGADATAEFVTFGESQGGHAALFTGQLAQEYAPELSLAGIAAAAPATNLTALFQENVGTTFGDVLAAYALQSWADVYDIALSSVVDPQALPVVERLSEQCIQNEAQMLALFPEAELLKLRFLTEPPWEVEPWRTVLEENTPGASLVDAPVLILQGEADPLVVPAVQRDFVAAWCERGQPVEYRTLPGVGHLDAGRASAGTVSQWARDRIDGAAWASNCSTVEG